MDENKFKYSENSILTNSETLEKVILIRKYQCESPLLSAWWVKDYPNGDKEYTITESDLKK